MKVVLLALPVLLGLFAPQTQPPAKGMTGPTGRYQMLTTQLSDVSSEEKTVFILDTATVRAWKYQSAFQYKNDDGKTVKTPSMFISIPVKGLNE